MNRITPKCSCHINPQLCPLHNLHVRNPFKKRKHLGIREIYTDPKKTFLFEPPKRQYPLVYLTIGIIKSSSEIYNKFIGPCLAQLNEDSYHLIIKETTTHPAAVYNQIIDETETKFLLLIHADITFNSDLLQQVSNSIHDNPNFGAMGWCGAGLLNNKKVCYRSQSGKTWEAETMDSCCILINKTQGIRFDEETFNDFHFYVDDYCCQARDKGHLVYTLSVDGMMHHSSTMTVLGKDWGRCVEYKRKLHDKWKRYVPTTAGGDAGWELPSPS